MGLGVVQIATRAKTVREHTLRVAMFEECIEQGQVALLRSLLAGDTSWEALRDHKRRNAGRIGADALGDIALARPVLEVAREMLPKMGKAVSTRGRYTTSINALERRGAPQLTAATTLRELPHVDWTALQRRWGRSAADWNHALRVLLTATSRFLGKRNVFTYQVRDALAPHMRGEPERVPDLSVELFHAIVRAARADIRPALVVLALTGMRVKTEYLACGVDHLMPATRKLRVPGTKTDGSNDVLSFDADDWVTITAGIPATLGYKRLHRLWQEACVEAGAGKWVETGETRVRTVRAAHRPKAGLEATRVVEPVVRYQGLRLHDLRHFCAQLAEEHGVSLGQIRQQLRHTDIRMTERYARQSATRAVSRAVGGALRKLTGGNAS